MEWRKERLRRKSPRVMHKYDSVAEEKKSHGMRTF